MRNAHHRRASHTFSPSLSPRVRARLPPCARRWAASRARGDLLSPTPWPTLSPSPGRGEEAGVGPPRRGAARALWRAGLARSRVRRQGCCGRTGNPRSRNIARHFISARSKRTSWHDINPEMGQNPKHARTRSARPGEEGATRASWLMIDNRKRSGHRFFFFFTGLRRFLPSFATHESPSQQRWQAAAAATPTVHALMGQSRRGSGAAGADVEAQRMACSLVPQPPVRRAARSPSLPLMWASLARPLCVDKNVRSGYGMQWRAGVPPLRRPASSRHPRGCNHRCLCAGSAATARPGRPFS